MLTSPLSYVFGPLIRHLKDVGYDDTNLAAAPYDWRIPPTHLQSRDNYFSNLADVIELVRPSKPVTL